MQVDGSIRGVTVVDQPVWGEIGVGSRLDALDALPDSVASAWVLAEPQDEVLCWSRLLPLLGDRSVFTWTTRLLEASAEPEEEDGTNSSSLRRVTRRPSLRSFPSRPYLESRLDRHDDVVNVVDDLYERVRPLLRRSSGFAIGIASAEKPVGEWSTVTKVLESHFVLASESANSPQMEGFRRRLVSLYVEVALELGFMPVLPLDRNVRSGFVIFCDRSDLPDVLDSVAQPEGALSGRPGSDAIKQLIEAGGGLGYR
ncbi:hypothetical protein [Streptomyces sp. NPDC051214]|uniref:hypothetical protein n=1 Tax=Streptomyces sp. NPDC051214 TaxID=3155282 RepID=UPI00343F308D